MNEVKAKNSNLILTIYFRSFPQCYISLAYKILLNPEKKTIRIPVVPKEEGSLKIGIRSRFLFIHTIFKNFLNILKFNLNYF